MGVAAAVVWDSWEGRFTSYREDRMEELFAHLRRADLVIGFNISGFDYAVLSAYDDGTLARLPTFDILSDLARRLGYRLSLAHLAEHTLGRSKSADGLQSLQWVKEGRLDLVEEYCQKDVEITRDLFYHGLEKGWVRFLARDGRLMELSLDWELAALVKRARK
jgi:DEAD/DEAH box helicase domain-containing protein